PRGRLRAPGGHLSLRDGPGNVRARRRLQGARARQPLRRRHERLPEYRSGQPGAHRHGQLAARRRPPARAHGRPHRNRSRRRRGMSAEDLEFAREFLDVLATAAKTGERTALYSLLAYDVEWLTPQRDVHGLEAAREELTWVAPPENLDLEF